MKWLAQNRIRVLGLALAVMWPAASARAAIEIYTVSPPGVFAKTGSETNIHQVCTLGEALNLILDDAGVNEIAFHDPIVDMCKDDTISNLDQYVKLDTVGEVTVKSDQLTYLHNQQGDITMRGLPYDQEPDVLVDGQPATSADVGNKQWDGAQHTLKFTAKHFSTYKAVAKGGAGASTATPAAQQRQAGALATGGLLVWGLAGIGLVTVMVLAIARMARPKPAAADPEPADGPEPEGEIEPGTGDQ